MPSMTKAPPSPREAKAHASPGHGFRLLLRAVAKGHVEHVVADMRMATLAMSAKALEVESCLGVKG